MGNGPGGLEEYQKVFREYDRLQGGFVWEWANHGLLKKDNDSESTHIEEISEIFLTMELL